METTAWIFSLLKYGRQKPPLLTVKVHHTLSSFIARWEFDPNLINLPGGKVDRCIPFPVVYPVAIYGLVSQEINAQQYRCLTMAVYRELCGTKAAAFRCEAALKKLGRAEKLSLIVSGDSAPL